MLERIVLRNFKCFDKLNLACSPLTVQLSTANV